MSVTLNITALQWIKSMKQSLPLIKSYFTVIVIDSCQKDPCICTELKFNADTEKNELILTPIFIFRTYEGVLHQVKPLSPSSSIECFPKRELNLTGGKVRVMEKSDN